MNTLADRVKVVDATLHAQARITFGMIRQEEYERISCQFDGVIPENELQAHFHNYQDKFSKWRQSRATHLIHALGKHDVQNVIKIQDVGGTKGYVRTTFYHKSILEAFFNTETTTVDEIVRLVREATMADAWDVKGEYESVMRAASVRSDRDIGEILDGIEPDWKSMRDMKHDIEEWLMFDEIVNALLIIQYSEPFKEAALKATIDGLSLSNTRIIMEAYTGGKGVLRYLVDKALEIVYSHVQPVGEEFVDIPPTDEIFFNMADMMVGLGVAENTNVLFDMGRVKTDDDVSREDKEDSVT